MTPKHMTRQAARSVLAAGLLGSALLVGAQTPGTYNGQNSQGGAMQVVVSLAPDGVSTEVTTLQATYQLTCELSATPVYLATVTWGYFPIDAQGAFDATYLWDRDWFQTRGRFAPGGTVTGDTAWDIAAVTRRPPHAAEVCASPSLGWSAAQAPGAAAAPSAPAPTLRLERRLDRSGRVVSERLVRLD